MWATPLAFNLNLAVRNLQTGISFIPRYSLNADIFVPDQEREWETEKHDHEERDQYGGVSDAHVGDPRSEAEHDDDR